MKIKLLRTSVKNAQTTATGMSLSEQEVVLNALIAAKKFVKTCEYRAGGPEDSGYYEFDEEYLARLTDAIDVVEGKN